MSALPERVAVVGAGVIGAGWAARFLSRGVGVRVWDPDPASFERLRRRVDDAFVPMRKLGWVEVETASLEWVEDLEAACVDAGFVQENAPEDETLKCDLLAQIDAHAPAASVIASSTSGFLASDLQRACARPERVLVGHPFHPVYLLPLVEVVGGERTEEPAVERAQAIYRAIGMHPLRVRNEIAGHLSDRLQEAVWREILHIVADGVATTAELDDALRYGPGLRWALFGQSLILHLAGGEGGMQHALDQFGPALERPWTHLVAPPLTPELQERMVQGTRAQAGGRSVRELERRRDEGLVAILEALRSVELGAGVVVPGAARSGRGGRVAWTPPAPPIRAASTGRSSAPRSRRWRSWRCPSRLRPRTVPL